MSAVAMCGVDQLRDAEGADYGKRSSWTLTNQAHTATSRLRGGVGWCLASRARACAGEHTLSGAAREPPGPGSMITLTGVGGPSTPCYSPRARACARGKTAGAPGEAENGGRARRGHRLGGRGAVPSQTPQARPASRARARARGWWPLRHGRGLERAVRADGNDLTGVRSGRHALVLGDRLEVPVALQ